MTERPFLAWPGWKHLRFALVLWLAAAAWFFWVYAGAGALNAHRAVRVTLYLPPEINVPFVPGALPLYLSFWLLFLAAPLVVRARDDFFALFMTFNVVVLVSGVCFLALPGKLGFADEPAGKLEGLFQFVRRFSAPHNLVPALPVALAVLCTAAFARYAKLSGKLILWSWTAAIALSSLAAHQHHLLDVISAFALGLAAYRFLYVTRFHRVHQPAG